MVAAVSSPAKALDGGRPEAFGVSFLSPDLGQTINNSDFFLVKWGNFASSGGGVVEVGLC